MTTRPFLRVQMRLCLCVMLRAMALRQPLPISAFVTLELWMSMTCGLTVWNHRPQLLLLRFGNVDFHGRYCVLSTLDRNHLLGDLVTFVMSHLPQGARILLEFASDGAFSCFCHRDVFEPSMAAVFAHALFSWRTSVLLI